MKPLRVIKIIKEIKSGGVWDELEAKKVCRDNNSPNTRDWLQFWCEIAHYGQSLTSVFQGFFASINKTFILAGRMDTRLSFYEV